MEKHLEVLDLLIQQETVDVTAKASNKNIPLHYLVRHQYNDQEQRLTEKIIHLMIKRGVSVNSANDMGETPLFQACLRGTAFFIPQNDFSPKEQIRLWLF